MSKTLLVIQIVHNIKTPFTLEGIRNRMRCDVSESTVRKALDSLPIMSASRPRGRHFYRVYFPLGWTKEAAFKWLDAQTESGKSKARIYTNVPKAQSLKRTPRRRTTQPRVKSHPMDYPKDSDENEA